MEAHRDFGQFRGMTEAELMQWLKKILAHRMAKTVRRYHGTQLRDVRIVVEASVSVDVAVERRVEMPGDLTQVLR